MVLISVLLVSVLATYVSTVRIGSFNLHQYGTKKSNDATLNNYIVRILNDFDIAIIQEITDVTIKAPYTLLENLNRISTSNPYSMVLSDRVGRSSSKEQFIFFNRESTSGVKQINYYLYKDKNDYFERPPFIGTFKVTKTGSSGVKYFTIINVHLRPSAAYQELLAVRYVIKDFIVQNPTYFDETATSLAQALADNVIGATASNKPNLRTNHPILIIGDFNGDCTYMTKQQLNNLHSTDFADFTWVISDDTNTNTRASCAYDRILINGNKFVKAIVPGSNMTVNYQQRFGLTIDQALDISDHFPVKFDINW